MGERTGAKVLFLKQRSAVPDWNSEAGKVNKIALKSLAESDCQVRVGGMGIFRSLLPSKTTREVDPSDFDYEAIVFGHGMFPWYQHDVRLRLEQYSLSDQMVVAAIRAGGPAERDYYGKGEFIGNIAVSLSLAHLIGQYINLAVQTRLNLRNPRG